MGDDVWVHAVVLCSPTLLPSQEKYQRLKAIDVDWYIDEKLQTTRSFSRAPGSSMVDRDQATSLQVKSPAASEPMQHMYTAKDCGDGTFYLHVDITWFGESRRISTVGVSFLFSLIIPIRFPFVLSPRSVPQNDTERVQDLLRREVSFAIIGGAWTSKTTFAYSVFSEVRSKHARSAVRFLTISRATALAAGESAETLYGFGGVPLMNELSTSGQVRGGFEGIVAGIRRQDRWLQSWRRVKILFVDGAFLLSQRTFACMDHTARVLRDCDAPFGGIQMVK